MKKSNSVFARNLSSLMLRDGLTQRALASLLNVAPSNVCQYMNGNLMPRMPKIDRLCQIFHCSRSDLLEEHAGATDPDERALVEDYRLLAPDEKEGVRNLAAGLASKYKKSAAAG